MTTGTCSGLVRPARVLADSTPTYTRTASPSAGPPRPSTASASWTSPRSSPGPTAGRTLAEFGADVVKINNPNEEGAGIHFSRHRYHTDVNRGKRSMLLDLKQAEGRDILAELIDRSDVFLQNFRPEAAERLGVTYDVVRQQRPDIVYVTVSAFGGPGPWVGWPGYEVQAQAASGLRYAGLSRPTGQPFAVNDYGTGLSGAFAAALGLYARARTGRGQQAEAALAYTATFLQSARLNGEPTRPSAGVRCSGLYQASDGWLFVGASADRLSQLTPDLSERALEDFFRSATVETWVERLTRAGIGAHRLVPIAELMRDAWVTKHCLSLTRVHDTGESITSVGPVARLSRTPVPARTADAHPRCRRRRRPARPEPRVAAPPTDGSGRGWYREPQTGEHLVAQLGRRSTTRHCQLPTASSRWLTNRWKPGSNVGATRRQ